MLIIKLGTLLVVYIFIACLSGCDKRPQAEPRDSSNHQSRPDNQICRLYGYKIVNSYHHDNLAFTQGLVFENDFLYESTGLYGHSTIRKMEPATAKIVKVHNLPGNFFGEGLTIFRDKIIQLTWESHIGFVYDKDTFKLIGQFDYPTQGWGITSDGDRLIMSDGTSTLYFLDPETFKEVGRLEVSDANGPVEYINELEFVKGQVYANIWLTNRIAIISPQDGRVIGWLDLTGLYEPTGPYASEMVPNGIAYNPQTDRLFVTGKFWPKIFEIELMPKSVR